MPKQTQISRKAVFITCPQKQNVKRRRKRNGDRSEKGVRKQKLVELNSLAEKYFSSPGGERRNALHKMIKAISCREDAENLRLILRKKGGAHSGSVDCYITIRCRELNI